MENRKRGIEGQEIKEENNKREGWGEKGERERGMTWVLHQ